MRQISRRERRAELEADRLRRAELDAELRSFAEEQDRLDRQLAGLIAALGNPVLRSERMSAGEHLAAIDPTYVELRAWALS